MVKISINKNKCKGCFLCLGACPNGVLGKGKHLNNQGFTPVIICQGDVCLGCGQCVLICPEACIEIHK